MSVHNNRKFWSSNC